MQWGPSSARRLFQVRVLLFGLGVAAVLAIGCSRSASVLPSPRVLGADGPVEGRDAVPARLLTWINADRASPAPDWPSVKRYLDFALVGQSVRDLPLASSIGGAGIGVAIYTNPNHQAQYGKPHFPENEPTDFAHQCDGTRIFKLGYGSPTPPPGPAPTPTDYATYLMDPHSSHLAQSWSDEVTGFEAQTGVPPAFVFEDTADSIRGSSAAPCRYSRASWTAASITLDQTMVADAALAGVATNILYNGLGTIAHPNPNQLPPAFGLNASTAGGMAENCYSLRLPSSPNDPDPPPQAAHGAQWLYTENVELAMAAAQKLFICNANSNDIVPAESLTDLRMYVIASVLLTYDPATTVLDEAFVPQSGFEVFPESSIVATAPLRPSPSDISQLSVGGLYARQYASCYVGGSPIGACAAVVNPSESASYPFPYQGTYSESLRIKGGGVLDAGAFIKSIGGVPATIGPHSAAIAFAPTPSPTP